MYMGMSFKIRKHVLKLGFDLTALTGRPSYLRHHSPRRCDTPAQQYCLYPAKANDYAYPFTPSFTPFLPSKPTPLG